MLEPKYTQTERFSKMQLELPTLVSSAKPEFTAEELENSFPLDQGRRFSAQKGIELVDSVASGMDRDRPRKRARRPEDERRSRASVEALLANVVAAHLNVVDPDRFVAVSLSRDHYNGSELSFKGMQDCCGYMRKMGLIEYVPGFRRPDQFGDEYFGRRTRIRAAPKLRQTIDMADLGRRALSRPTDQLIRLKGRHDGVGEPPENIEASRAVIEAVNRRLAATDIGVPTHVIAALKAEQIDDQGEDTEERARQRRYAGDLTARSLYRSFKGDWQSGGRFYGGWWMSFARELRPSITLDGEEVVELDYTTLHPTLLYARAGLSLNHDPYVVYPWQGKPMRDLGKRTFNRLLNHRQVDPIKRLRIRAAPGDLAVMPKGVSFADYRDRLIEGCRGIEHWFGTGEGTHLQYEDSELALSVLAAMEAKGIPVLPIHDSFIVPVCHEEELNFAMMDAFLTRYGDIISVDRKGYRRAASPGEARDHDWVA